MQRANRTMDIAEFRDHSPRSLLRTSRGITFIALITIIAIMGILLGAAGKYWSAVMARENEEELLYRGNQYRTAIERYYTALPGRQQFPVSIDDLLKDDRFPVARRHLRHKYTDPITGEDFEVIVDKLKGNRIVGVRSTSDKKPIRQKNFPEPYQEFEGKEKYSDWEFKYTTPVPPAPVMPPGHPAPPQPRGLPPGHPLLPGSRPGQQLLPGQRQPGQSLLPGTR